MGRCRFILIAGLFWISCSYEAQAVDNELAEVQRQLAQQLAQQGALLEQQQRTLSLQAAELESLQQQLRLAPSSDEPLQAPFQSIYADEFTSRSADSANSDAYPFQPKIGSWLQLRHTLFDSDGLNADQNDIEFERLRLVFSGRVWSPDLKYFFQFDADSDQSETVDMLDYFVTYDLSNACCLQPNGLSIRVGKWKMPFNRARAESGQKMQFPDRSMASSLFDINRSIGIGLIAKNEIGGRPMQTHVAIHNGLKTGGFQPVRSGSLDRNFGVSGRVFTDWIGNWGKDGETDLKLREFPAIRIGGGFAWTQVDREGMREFDRQRVVDSGMTLSSLLPAGVEQYNVALFSVDANLKYRGASVAFEYYFRRMSNFSGGLAPAMNDRGFLIQTGYFLIPAEFELAARYSRIAGNSGSLGGAVASADEVAAGVNWYWRNHNAKLQFDATHLNGAPISDRALNILPGDKGMLYRTQLQLSF